MAVNQLTDSEFQKEVIDSKSPILVDFWAEWCGPCRALAPKLEQLSEEMSHIKVVKMNIDENPETPAKYGVRGIPSLLFFNAGEHKGQLVGNQPADKIKEFIESHLS